MNIDKTIAHLEEMKKDATNSIVKHNIQMKIDILTKKKRDYDVRT